MFVRLNSSKYLEAIQMSINWGIDKQNVVYLYSGVPFSNKKEWTTYTCNNMDKCQKYAKWKKPHKRIYTVWLHLYEIARTGKTVETAGFLGLGLGAGIDGKWTQGILGVMKVFWSLSVLMVTQLCKFTKTDFICILQMGKFYAIVNYTLKHG